MEALDFGLVGGAGVTDEQPGDEDGEEAGAVRDRCDPVDRAGGGERA